MMKTRCDEKSELVRVSLTEARNAQAWWVLQPIPARIDFLRELRRLVAAHATELASTAAAVSGRPLAEKLASEVLPLTDACRWLERRMARVLAPRRCEREGRPFWMRGMSFEVQRQPFGVVLVIGPANYPLFLPAVQTLHALAAGNAVLLKPAPRTYPVASAFAKLTLSAGLGRGLLAILPESVQAARSAVARGVDKVIFTGSSENGRDLHGQLAATSTPAVMELSGEDAVLVLEDADLELVVRALRFGLRWNAGDTCIAPRRLIVVESVADELFARLSRAGIPPLLLARVPDEPAAVQCASAAGFALGVSIFSRNIARARVLAARIKSGFVLINDLIVPTADPRMPFGGVKASGFGVTRGEEGLLEMTFPHVVAVRRGKWRPHFDELGADAAQLFSSYILAVHGKGRRRLGALRELVSVSISNFRYRKTTTCKR
jgi:acyl-CoA reductase-like NAD-dependent aldehyde dehydrogenase